MPVLQGIGAGFIPGNLDTTLLNEVVCVSSEDAIAMAKRLTVEVRQYVVGRLFAGERCWSWGNPGQGAAMREIKGSASVSLQLEHHSMSLSNNVTRT